jgi:radial spoke head protein 9
MECDILTHFQRLSGLGVVLSQQERACIELAFPILQRDYKFSRVQFWGKINGVEADYLIASGHKAALDEKATLLFSHDGVTFAQLPLMTPRISAALEAAGYGLVCQRPFRGDSSFICIPAEPEQEAEPLQEPDTDTAGADGDAPAQLPVEKLPPLPAVTELHRLVFAVGAINAATDILPARAFMLAARGHVASNPSFRGLSPEQTAVRSSYARKSSIIKALTENISRDPFVSGRITTLADDPTQLWDLEFNPLNTMATIRSRLWPGHAFYCFAQSRVWGRAYFGSGCVSTALAFE